MKLIAYKYFGFWGVYFSCMCTLLTCVLCWRFCWVVTGVCLIGFDVVGLVCILLLYLGCGIGLWACVFSVGLLRVDFCAFACGFS